MIVVFDLDDTLYPEISYVKSGFKAVATFLSQKFNLNSDEVFRKFITVLERMGRGRVFDEVLLIYNIYSKSLVRKCVKVYRTHGPEIKLDQSSEELIYGLKKKDIPIYLITDGNKVVQDKKVKALGLYEMFNKVYITHRYGLDKAKPSPYCFLKVAKRESVSPEEVIYIGDNPNKDFIGIKQFGFKTIRINQGMFKDYYIDKQHEADIKVENIGEISAEFLNRKFNMSHKNE